MKKYLSNTPPFSGATLNRVIEVLAVAGLVIFTFWWVWVVLAAGSGRAFFYQSQFSPAVSIACDGDFQAILGYADDSELETFLSGQKSSLNCADVPAERGSLNAFQAGSRYLMTTVGLLWRITGVNWDSVKALYAALMLIYAVSCYGVCRLLFPAIPSLAIIYLSVFSDLQADNIIHLRDFSKAPFIWFLLFFSLWLMLKNPTGAKAVKFAIVAGLVAGLGIGFRVDVLYVIPVAMLSILLWQPDAASGGVRWAHRGTIAGLFFGSFLTMAIPFFSGTARSGGALTHVIFLGLMKPFDSVLSISDSFYDIGYEYNDIYAFSLFGIYNAWNSVVDEFNYLSTGHDVVGAAFLLDLIRAFPADMYSRAIEAVKASIGIYYLNQPFLRSSFSDALNFMPIIIGLALFLLNLRLAIFVSVSVLYLGAITVLQFSGRHVFHFEFLSALILAVFICSPYLLYRYRKKISVINLEFKGLLVGAAFFLTTFSFAPAVLGVAQAASVTSLLSSAESLKTTGGAFELEYSEFGYARFIPAKIGYERISIRSFAPIYFGYIKINFSKHRCGGDVVKLSLKYKASEEYFRWNHLKEINTGYAQNYLFPLIRIGGDADSSEAPFSKLEAIEVPESQVSCIESIRFVSDPAPLRLPLELTYSNDWEASSLVRSKEPMATPEGVPTVIFPEGIALSVRRLKDELEKSHVVLAPTWINDSVSVRSDGAMIVNGLQSSAFSYLARWPGLAREAEESFLVVEGTLVEGGFSIGFLVDNLWSSYVNVKNRGRFVIVLQPPSNAHDVNLSNNLTEPSLKNVFEITKIRWISGASLQHKVATLAASGEVLHGVD